MGTGRKPLSGMTTGSPVALSGAPSPSWPHTPSAPGTSVWLVQEHGLDALLVPRLSRAATRERAALLPLIGANCSGAGGDDRRLVLCVAPKGALSSKAAYAASTMAGVRAANADFLWGSPSPLLSLLLRLAADPGEGTHSRRPSPENNHRGLGGRLPPCALPRLRWQTTLFSSAPSLEVSGSASNSPS